MATKHLDRSAADFLPEHPTLKSLREAAAACKGCDLYKNATQTVFGEGACDAAVVLIGEKPGDQEDKKGHPFVGPAGRLLDNAILDAGIPRDKIYITNAVKHFKWAPRGKRRIHKKPGELEIEACLPWLEAELKVIKPQVVVCLGTTAARAAVGKTVRLKDYRGQFTETRVSSATFFTIHPSAILRVPEESMRQPEYESFVADMRRVHDQVW